MRIAHVFYREEENQKLAHIFQLERPDWALTSIPEARVGSLLAIVDLLKTNYDAILLRMSLPFGLAVKMAELSRRKRGNTPRIILYSHTQADSSAITMLFDGHIHPDRDYPNVCDLIDQYIVSERIHLEDWEIEEAMLKIINSSESIKAMLTHVLRRRHQSGHFTMADYNYAVDRSIPDDLNQSVTAYDIFISHSTKDSKLALEICALLKARGLSPFIAEHSIEVGAGWQDSIRDALRTSRELLLIITPNSVSSPWIIAEVGAGWALGKTTNICSFFVDPAQMMDLVKATQVRQIVTQADKDALAIELASHLRTGGSTTT
jgi:hypothetical protein